MGRICLSVVEYHTWRIHWLVRLCYHHHYCRRRLGGMGKSNEYQRTQVENIQSRITLMHVGVMSGMTI